MRGDDLVGRSTVLPGPGEEVLDRTLRASGAAVDATSAPSAISGGSVSADGEARQTLPTTVARLRTWIDAKFACRLHAGRR